MKVGTGWLGWTPQQTLNSELWQIELALEGKIELLQMIYGKGGDEDTPGPEMTPAGQGVVSGKLKDRARLSRTRG